MSRRPSSPEDLPDEAARILDDQSPETLRRIARYAETLAEYRDARRSERPGGSPGDEEGGEDGDPGEGDEEGEGGEIEGPDDAPTEVPDDVPPKATITVKEINDNRYYYWQWRDGDAVKSKYEAPVDPDE